MERVEYPGGVQLHLEHEKKTGRLIAMTGIDGVRTQLLYNQQGTISEIQHAGLTTALQYDALGRNTQVIAPTGQRIHLRHNTAGQLLAFFDQQNNRIEFERDREGQLLQTRLLNPDGTLAQAPHDYSPQDEANQGRALLRQLLNTLERRENLARPDLIVQPYAQAEHLLAAFTAGLAATPQAVRFATDSKGRPTHYHFDDFGRMVRQDSPVTGHTDYQYDNAGRIIGRRLADGSHASYRRDPAGRITAVQAHNALGQQEENAQIEWGRANKPVRIRYLAGQEDFAYDDAGRLIEHVQHIDGQRFVLRYAFDQSGRMVAKTLPNGQRLQYRYRGQQEAKAGLLESVWLQGLDSRWADRLTNGLFDRPVIQGLNSPQDSYQQRHFAFGNGLEHRLQLDRFGRTLRNGNAQVGQTQLHHPDPDAPETDTADTAGSVTASTFLNTPLGRRAQEEAARVLISRLKGRIAGWHDWATPPSPSGQIERLLANAALQHDAQGRQISDGTRDYRYNSLGQLIEVQERQAPASQTPLAQYRYNLFGQRIAKTVAVAGSSTTKTTYYFYDGAQLVAEADAAGSITSQYISINDKPVALLRDGQLLSIHSDHRNAPLAVTDEARTVLWQASVADYLGSSPAPNQPNLGRIELNLRGSNQYFDAETGLHYNTHRYYNPQAGRYLTPDPLGLAAGPDLYAYALGQPHSFTDPLGLAPILTNADVAEAAFTERLQYVFEAAALQFPDAVGQALADLVSPENLLTTGAVFALWAGSHAVGVGFLVDIALTGMAWFTYGMAAVEMVKGMISLITGINNAQCLSDLDQGAVTLTAVMMTAIDSVGGRPKAANMLKTVKGKSATQAAEKHISAPGPKDKALVISPLKIKEVAAKMTQDAIKSGQLKQKGPNEWESTGGLLYKGKDPQGNNRIEHVTGHLTVDNTKPKQSIFAVPSDKLLNLIDQAWMKKGNPNNPIDSNKRTVYEIDMGKPIGTNGESKIRIIIEKGTSNEIVSSYPIF